MTSPKHRIHILFSLQNLAPCGESQKQFILTRNSGRSWLTGLSWQGAPRGTGQERGHTLLCTGGWGSWRQFTHGGHTAHWQKGLQTSQGHVVQWPLAAWTLMISWETNKTNTERKGCKRGPPGLGRAVCTHSTFNCLDFCTNTHL